MTIEDANQQFSLGKADREVMSDPTLTTWGKAKALTTLQMAAAKPDAGYSLTISPADVARAAVGAGLGWGAGTMLGKMLGSSEDTVKTFQNLGMGFGTLLNMGATMKKNSEAIDRRNAFRLGFLKAAMDQGLIKEAIHSVIPITPEFVTAPLNGLLAGSASAASTAGGLLSHLTSADSTDVDMEKMQLEQRGLEEQEQKLKALRNAQAIRKVLDARRTAGR